MFDVLIRNLDAASALKEIFPEVFHLGWENETD